MPFCNSRFIHKDKKTMNKSPQGDAFTFYITFECDQPIINGNVSVTYVTLVP